MGDHVQPGYFQAMSTLAAEPQLPGFGAFGNGDAAPEPELPEKTPFFGEASAKGFRIHSSQSIDVSDELACEDELNMASPSGRYSAVAEQLTEFLSNFSADEQERILEPFMGSTPVVAAEPYIDEARQFVSTFLAAYPEADQRLALAHIGMVKSPDSADTDSRKFMRYRRMNSSPAVRRTNTTSFLLGSDSDAEHGLAERQSIVAAFQRHDQGGSGTISRSQFVVLLKELDPEYATKDVEGMLSSEWDHDSIGYADFATWLCR